VYKNKRNNLKNYPYFYQYSIKLSVREFFSLPFLVDDFSSPDDYIIFLQNLSDYTDILEIELSQEDQEFIINNIRKYLHILINQVNTDKLSFIEKCKKASPEFIKDIFVFSKI